MSYFLRKRCFPGILWIGSSTISPRIYPVKRYSILFFCTTVFTVIFLDKGFFSKHRNQLKCIFFTEFLTNVKSTEIYDFSNCTLQRKSHLCISFLGIARPQSQFPHSCVYERFIYSQDRSTYFLEQNRQTNPGNI